VSDKESDMSEQEYYQSSRSNTQTASDYLLHKRVVELRKSEFNVRKVVSIGTTHKSRKPVW
jgi:hypothetical protein